MTKRTHQPSTPHRDANIEILVVAVMFLLAAYA